MTYDYRVGTSISTSARYRVVFGGQFEEAARSLRNLGTLAVAILAGM
jgi:hypothetical protein